MEKIKVILAEQGKPFRLIFIENSLEAFQAAVGGYIEIIAIPGVPGAVFVMDEEGKIKGLGSNILVPENEDVLVGSVLAVGTYGEDFVGLNETQIGAISAYIAFNRIPSYIDEG